MVHLPIELSELLRAQLIDLDWPAMRKQTRVLRDMLDNDWHPPVNYAETAHSGDATVRASKKERLQAKTRRDNKAKKDAMRYDDLDTMAHAIELLPQTFAATRAVLGEVKQRTGEAVGDRAPFEPTTVIDWGSGVGTVAWAAKELWPALSAYVGVDRSHSMRQLALQLAPDIAHSHLLRCSFFDTFEHRKKPPHSPLPVQIEAADSLDLATTLKEPETVLAIAAFTLGDIDTEQHRRKLVKRMWESGAELIVLIDRGSPAGFERIAKAREQLLKYGRAEVAEPPLAQALDVLDTETGEISAAASSRESGCHTVAPVCCSLSSRSLSDS